MKSVLIDQNEVAMNKQIDEVIDGLFEVLTATAQFVDAIQSVIFEYGFDNRQARILANKLEGTGMRGVFTTQEYDDVVRAIDASSQHIAVKRDAMAYMKRNYSNAHAY